MANDDFAKIVPLPRWLPAFAVLAVAGSSAWWAIGCSRQAETPPDRSEKREAASITPLARPAAPPSGYVGSEACARCHEKLCDSYHSHPMARSFSAVADVKPREDDAGKPSFSTPGSYRYRVERTAEGMFHRESRSDAEGKVVYNQGVQVHYAIGSGKRGRTYAIDRGGLLFESPITWYGGRNRWDLSPGYVAGRHPRFDRRITNACLGCHAGRVNPDPEQIYRFRQPVVLEAAISCERCHGPGKDHIAFHDGPRKKPPAADPIVNPAKLPPRKRDAVCYQCHLHGEERVLRYGRSEFDFRPGMELEDVWAVFVRGGRIGPDGSTRAVSHVEQMRQSVCYQKSDGAMGCITCHDPHGTPSAKQRVAFYREKCNRCHSGPSKKECSKPLAERNLPAVQNSCIQCHMPRLKASDVPHTSQTDHRVLRDPRKNTPRGDDAARLTLFDDAADRLPNTAVERVEAIFTAREARLHRRRDHAGGALQRLRRVLKAAPDDVDSLRAAGTAALTLGLRDEARKHWTRALGLEPKNEPVLVDLVALEHNAGNLQSGLAYVDRLIAINPWRADFYGRKAHMLGQQRQFERGVKVAKKALELNPSLSNVHAWLAETYRLLGNDKESRYHDKMRKRLAPSE
jgi:Flp pilus assembly protein TadD